MNDLPPGIRDAFRLRFTPLLRQFLGDLKPWEGATEHDIWNLWGTTFPYAQSQPTDELMYKIGKLVSFDLRFSLTTNLAFKAEDRAHEWRNKMGRTAMQAVQTLFEKEGLTTAEERSEHAKFLLQGPDHKRPFYYKVWRENNGPIVIHTVVC